MLRVIALLGALFNAKKPTFALQIRIVSSATKLLSSMMLLTKEEQ